MTIIVYQFIAFAIALAAFIYGAVYTFKKKVPLFFQLNVCAVGCYALEELWSAIYALCGNTDVLNLGIVGTLGCWLFQLSANYGSLDSLVDESKEKSRKARIISLITATFEMVLIVYIIFFADERPTKDIILAVFAFVPTVPALYFMLKHLLLPLDSFGFLKATRMCNLFGVLFCVFNYVLVYYYSTANLHMNGITLICLALIAFGRVISCKRGIEIWGTIV